VEKTAFLVPKPGITVPDLKGDALPAEGKRVKLNTYWSRRIKEGCVTVQLDKKDSRGKR
jgi:hypothetical protein